jgi:hypothetical protein
MLTIKYFRFDLRLRRESNISKYRNCELYERTSSTSSSSVAQSFRGFRIHLKKSLKQKLVFMPFFPPSLSKLFPKNLRKGEKSEQEKRLLFMYSVSNGARSLVLPVPEFYKLHFPYKQTRHNYAIGL